jgi:hypothetical protein
MEYYKNLSLELIHYKDAQDTCKIEEFRDITDYEGSYKVSNLGRVKSLRRKREMILHPTYDISGYLKVSFHKNNSQKTKKIHQLVAISFLNHKPDGREVVVDHINNFKLDNRLENLRIVTARENCSKDRKNKYSKLTGVFWHKRMNKWNSSIYINKKQVHLGYFESEISASLSYQKALYYFLNLKTI